MTSITIPLATRERVEYLRSLYVKEKGVKVSKHEAVRLATEEAIKKRQKK